MSSATVARGKARSAMIRAVHLSMGARLLYLLLDDMDWNSEGRAWPKQATIAAHLGCSVAQVKRLVTELVGAGRLTVDRKRAHCVYLLAWRDSSVRSYLEKRDSSQVSDQDSSLVSYPSIYESIEAEPNLAGGSVENCERCSGEGWRRHETSKRNGPRSFSVVVCGCIPMTLEEAHRLAGGRKTA